MDLGEFKLATTPLKDMVSGKPVIAFDADTKLLGQRAFRKIENLNNISPNKKKLKVEQFDDLMDSLDVPLTGLDITNMASKMDTDTGLGYIASHAKALSHLASKKPSRHDKSIFGLKKSPVSDFDKELFIRQAQLVDDPLTIFEYISDGSLLNEDIDTIEEVYPVLTDTIKKSMVKKYSSSAPKLKPEQEAALKKFLNIQDELLPSIQREYRKDQQEASPQPQNMNFSIPNPTPGQQQASGSIFTDY